MLFFRGQLLPPSAREAIKFCAAAGVGDAPFGFNPAAALEAVQGGIERTLFQGKPILGNDRNAFGDVPAVQVGGGEGLENEKIECSLEQFVADFCHRAGFIVALLHQVKPFLSKLDNKPRTSISPG